ncbi:MAG: biotin--[acetyl-CoA-carboxylase] ligase [Acidimicrobiales bacterium]
MLDEGARSALATTRFADVRWFGEIDSTNRYLLDEARRGAAAGLVAVADHQTAGRGRLGRTWVAPPGASLLVSVLLRPDLPAGHLHLASVAVALSMADACARRARFEPEIKWPNDLMVGERKLAGVLAETDLGRPGGSGPPAVVVGIGINVNWPAELPEELADRAVAINHITGRPADRSRLLVAMLEALEPRAGQLDSEAGRSRLSSEYRARCATVGREVRIDLQDESFTGVATDVDDHGHLLVQTGVCLREVTAGDVVHLRPT